ncbi:MAG: hypothetical protein ACI9MC_001620 [Kiritimatiellia bacterium]|jgi:hypothetical protein
MHRLTILALMPLCALTGCDMIDSLLEPAEVASARKHLKAHEYAQATPLLREALGNDSGNAELRELAAYAYGLSSDQGLAELGRWCGGSAVPAIQQEARDGLASLGVNSASWPEALTVLHGAATRGHNRDLSTMKSVDLRAAKATFAGCLVAFGDDAGTAYLAENIHDEWGAEQDVLTRLGTATDGFLRGLVGQEGHSALKGATDLLKLAGLSDIFGGLRGDGELDSGHAALETQLVSVNPSWTHFGDSPCEGIVGLPLASRVWPAEEIDGLRNTSSSRPDLTVYSHEGGDIAILSGRRGDKSVVRALRWSKDTWTEIAVDAAHIAKGHHLAGVCTAATVPDGASLPFGTLKGDQIALRWYTGAQKVTSGGGGYYGKRKVSQKPGWKWQVIDLHAE